jgi:alpha-mannosidase
MKSAYPSSVQEILLLHHSHMDVGYTHSQPIFWELQGEYITQAIDWLDETAEMPEVARPKWTCEASEPVRKWLSKSSPSQIERFKQLHKQGRLGVSALRWHTTPLADRAGLQRLLDGKDELEQLLEAKIPVACQHDVTGVPWPLADVLLDAGVDFFVMAINIHLGRAAKPRPGMFMWEAPSGRKLRVFNGNHYTMFDQLFHAWDDSVDRMAEGWASHAQHLEKIGYPLDFAYLTTTCSPVMWDNAPPNPYLPDLIKRWNEAGRGPRVSYATFDDLRQRALTVSESQLPVYRGDWTDFWNFGCASSPRTTALNQTAKELIRAATMLTEGQEHPVLQLAREKVDLYDEHTFGYYDSNTVNPQAQTTELLKQALAYEGHEMAAFALMDGLERLAQNPLQDKGIKGVLLCNPGPEPLMVRLELPETWFAPRQPSTERTYRASRLSYPARSWGESFPGESARSFGSVELPPYSWKTMPLSQLPEAQLTSSVSHIMETQHIERREANFAPLANHQHRVGRMESSHYVLRYDPDFGRILSLTDRKENREILAPRDGLDFFAFVRERSDALVEDRRYAFYQRDLDKEKMDAICWKKWLPVRERATRVVACRVKETPGCVIFERTFQAPGMIHLVQRIYLLADDPVIRLEVEMELFPEPSPQSIYFAFPLAMRSGWRAAYDTAGAIIKLDEDQIPGACLNWITTENFAAMWDDAGGAALFTADAPMIQFGDFHFGPPLDAVPRPENPLLLAWPVNNYWDTNFPRVQAGRIRLRYGFLPFGPSDLLLVQRAARKFRQPSLIWPVTSGGRDAASGKLK